DLDTLSTKPQGRLNAALHGPPKGDALLELSRDIFTHQLRIKLRFFDFLDRDVDLPPVLFFKVGLQLIDFCPLAPDDDAGASSMNDHPGLIARTFDFDFRYACMIESRLDHFSNLDVLMEQLGVVFPGLPAGTPG